MRLRLMKGVTRVLDALVPIPTQERVFGYLYNRTRGQGMGNPESNGEYHLLRRVAQRIGGMPSTVFDVGGNKGDWTLHLLSHGGPQVHVHVFEPSKPTCDLLKTTLERAIAGHRVTVVNAALGEQPGEGLLHVVQVGDGSNSLYARKGIGWDRVVPERVQIESGDGYCRRCGIERIDLMKIDVEGHELSVLKGFAGMMQRGAIDRIQLEYGGAWIDSKVYLRDVFELCTPLGYLVGKIHPRGVKVFETYRQSEENFIYANYFLLKKELRGEVEEIGS